MLITQQDLNMNMLFIGLQAFDGCYMNRAHCWKCEGEGVPHGWDVKSFHSSVSTSELSVAVSISESGVCGSAVLLQQRSVQSEAECDLLW
jgi:hypothetical protein